MSGAVKRYFIHLRGEETLHMAMDLNDYDVFLLQCVAEMSRGLATAYQPEMTVEAAPEGEHEECPSCGESLPGGER